MANETKFKVKYGPAAPTSTETWAATEWHCPGCGQRKVWQEQGSGDFYVGAELMCAGCGFQFTMPTSVQAGDNLTNGSVYKARLGALQRAELVKK